MFLLKNQTTKGKPKKTKKPNQLNEKNKKTLRKTKKTKKTKKTNILGLLAKLAVSRPAQHSPEFQNIVFFLVFLRVFCFVVQNIGFPKGF